MNFKLSYFKFTQQQIRFLSSSKRINHYDSLGIPSTSTQGEVKSAYYKLSMMYHPDKNQSVESAQKFREINNAYEVLGNVKTRKLYDKGLAFHGGATTTTDDSLNKFHRSRETRSRPPPPTGRTPIYDFDEWSKNHYGATFHRQMEHKRRMKMERMSRQQAEDSKFEKIFMVLGMMLAVCTFFFSDSTDYDIVAETFSLKPPKNIPKD